MKDHSDETLTWSKAVGFVVAFTLSIGLGAARPIHAGEREKASAAKLELLGAQITKDREGKVESILIGEQSFPPTPFRLTDTNIEDVHFEHLSHLKSLDIFAIALTDRGLLEIAKTPSQLQMMGLCGEKLSEKGLIPLLKKQKSLYSLSLQRSCSDDRVLPEIAKLDSLRILHLHGPNVTDKGVAELAVMARLVILDLDGTGLSDAGLADVGKMTRLFSLSIRRTKVTNEGLEHLGNLRHLRSLTISAGSKVTKNGVMALQRRLPNLEISEKEEEDDEK